MPRQARVGEHRNDHQLDTAREMARLSNVTVVEDGEALHAALDLALARGFEAPRASATREAASLAPLLDEIRDFVWSGAAPAGFGAHRAGERAA